MLIYPLRIESEVICLKLEVKCAFVLYEQKFVNLMQNGQSI